MYQKCLGTKLAVFRHRFFSQLVRFDVEEKVSPEIHIRPEQAFKVSYAQYVQNHDKNLVSKRTHCQNTEMG